MVGEEEGIRKLKRYVMLGSFLGGLIGATIAVLVFPQSSEERKRTICDIQQDLYRPVKVKFNELVEHVGNSLINALDEAAKKVANGKMKSDDELEEEG
ncbi:MAG: YtxH domain-containing protein [Nitrospirae bacterium]|nr:YtxH domain-containing protein [Nitrospirota bacterium]MBF0591046.1 YtxH domain-containing protein [Nitrospirota bacterium]